MVLLRRDLYYKHRKLSSDPQHTIQSWVWWPICNPIQGRRETFMWRQGAPKTYLTASLANW